MIPTPKTKALKAPTSGNGQENYHIVEKFAHGYRNREDKTILPAGILVEGSQNVLTNTAQRIASRQGYVIDGQTNTTIAPILSAFDWQMHTGDTQHLRAGLETSGSNGKLQFRYVATAAGQSWSGNTFTDGQVYWIDLMTGLTSVNFNFTDYWDTTLVQARLLFVNGTSNIYEWSGGVTTYASSTVNTLTKQGTETWAELGFKDVGSVTINGTVYTYSGGYGTTTLTGVAPNPTLGAYVAGAVIYQTVITHANATITGLPPAFENDLIANLGNQIYIGSNIDNSVYVSKQNDFTDFGFTSPVRVVGEGAVLTLDGTPNALIPQEDEMYATAGKDQWYQTQFQLSADLAAQSLTVNRLKTTGRQAAQTQAMTTKIKNDVAFISFEPIVNTLGRVDNVVLTPQVTDISFPIVNDMNNYDFTDASAFYLKMFLYIAVPREGKVLIYNMTDPKNPYWEAPQILPISRFYSVDGELYGHSYQVNESYKLFTGYNDNGNSYNCVATFSFNNYGTRTSSKSFNQHYTEGYINSNTTLTLGLQYDIDGCATVTTYNLVGTDTQFVCVLPDNASLGKVSLGKNPLGSTALITSPNQLPPKFRWIRTFPRKPFYEQQTTFSSSGVDQQWEILAFGGAATLTAEGNNKITE